jgi:hypothetical protein
MQTVCDRCELKVKEVGRLTKVRWKGLTQMLCKGCKRRVKLAYN